MKIERNQGVAWRKVGDEMVVIHLARHRIFGLDGTAGLIWEALSEPRDMKALETIVSESAAKGADVINAVHLFVADLADEDLVEVVGQLPDTSKGDTVVDFPRIEWREELQQFAGKCHLIAGQSHQCNQHPGGS